MKNSDTQFFISQMVFFDELQDLSICHLWTSLDPDWQSACGQVGCLLVIFCAREVSSSDVTVICTMLYVVLEEGSNLSAVAMWCPQPLTQDPLVGWWNHGEEIAADAAIRECAEGQEEINTIAACEGRPVCLSLVKPAIWPHFIHKKNLVR